MSINKPMPLNDVRSTFPIGARVAFYPVRGLAKFEISEVRSEAWTLGHGETVVQIDGRRGGVAATHLALATDRQPAGLARRMAEGRISARANGKRFRAIIDKMPLHSDDAPQGFETRQEATAFARTVRDTFREARAARLVAA